MNEAPLSQLGRYRILEEVGRGAMGVVYKAEDPLLNRTVAIKTILLSADAAERSEYEARFYQEAKAAGGLNHRNIITIYDIGREGDVAFMAMELIEGIELRELMWQRRLSLPEAIDIAAQVAEGLGVAHRQGVVHRDIKPANIMIVDGRQAKIMDFGIARVRTPDIKTQTGMLLGSPKYMSPEQVTGLAIDHRSDIFSLGLMLYEMVAGVAPFAGSADVAQLMYHISKTRQRAPSAINAAVPTLLDLIVARALEKDPQLRYQRAEEFAADLRACSTEVDAAGTATSGPATGDAARAAAGAAIPMSDSGASPVDDAMTARNPAAMTVGNVGAATLRNTAATTLRADEASTRRIAESSTGRDGQSVDAGFVDVDIDATRNTAGPALDDSVEHFPVSRRFDSTEGLARLAALAAGVDGVGGVGEASSTRPAGTSPQGSTAVSGSRWGMRHGVLAAALVLGCLAATAIALL
jgi:serine/threonine protein kinase